MTTFVSIACEYGSIASCSPEELNKECQFGPKSGGSKCFHFYFKEPTEMHMVLHKAPRSFDNGLLTMQRISLGKREGK